MKKATNDQVKLIQLLKKKKWNDAWELVKYVGYDDENDITKRYLIFKKACNDFDPAKNNNFIHFYKKYIKYLSFHKDETFVTTSNYYFIKELKNEHISPSGEESEMVKMLRRFHP